MIAVGPDREREARQDGDDRSAGAGPPAELAFSQALRDGEPAPQGSKIRTWLLNELRGSGSDPQGAVLRQRTFANGDVVAIGLVDRDYCVVELQAAGGGGAGCGFSTPPDDPFRPHAMWSKTRDGYRVSGAVVDGVASDHIGESTFCENGS